MKIRHEIVVDLTSTKAIFADPQVEVIENNLLNLFLIYCLSKRTWTIPKKTAIILLCKYQQENQTDQKNDGGKNVRLLKRMGYIEYYEISPKDVRVIITKKLKQKLERSILRLKENGEILFEIIQKDEIENIPEVYQRVHERFYYRLSQSDIAYIDATDFWKLSLIQGYLDKKKVVKSSKKRA